MKTVLTWMRESDERWFDPIFDRFPGVRVLNARREDTSGVPYDGLLLTGGSDIDAAFLEQPVPDPSVILDADPKRDAWEFPVTVRTARENKPVLAICRGLQVLNVSLHGTLHLHIPGHTGLPERDEQPLRYLHPASHRFALVNSSHHQALANLAPGIEVQAVCALDGVVEQAWMPDRRFVWGTQYHPERGSAYGALFADFFAAVQGANPTENGHPEV